MTCEQYPNCERTNNRRNIYNKLLRILKSTNVETLLRHTVNRLGSVAEAQNISVDEDGFSDAIDIEQLINDMGESMKPCLVLTTCRNIGKQGDDKRTDRKIVFTFDEDKATLSYYSLEDTHSGETLVLKAQIETNYDYCSERPSEIDRWLNTYLKYIK